jgi:chemotaxis signal transduction protein
MRTLIWTVKEKLFALDVRHIREVCPVVSAQSLPSSPPWMLGLFDFHGALIPLLDAGILTGQAAIEPQVGSRTLLIEVPLNSDSPTARTAIFGLRVEQAIGLRDLDDNGAWNPSAGLPGFEHLREVMNIPEGRVQVFDAARIAQQHQLLLQGASAVAIPTDRRLVS